MKKNAYLLIWDRPETIFRPVPEPVSRKSIVRVALKIADAESLDSVSFRNIGRALSIGPMRLYGYVETKEELLDLMIDAVFKEMLLPLSVLKDWKSALRLIAKAMRKVSLKHSWLADLLGGRPQQGPNALAHLEITLSVLRKRFTGIDQSLLATKTLYAYILGAIRAELSEVKAEKLSGSTKKQWQESTEPYMRRLFESGKFPGIESVVNDATHASPTLIFEAGLDIFIEGLSRRNLK